jgi:hypothetical protein
MINFHHFYDESKSRLKIENQIDFFFKLFNQI